MCGDAKAVAHAHPHTYRCTIFSCICIEICMFVCMRACTCVHSSMWRQKYLCVTASQTTTRKNSHDARNTLELLATGGCTYTCVHKCSPRWGALGLCQAVEMNHALCSPTLVPLFNFNESV